MAQPNPVGGIWHTTTFESAQRRQKACLPASVVGHKRPLQSQQAGNPPPPRRRPVRSTAKERTRLKASRIYSNVSPSKELSEYSQRKQFPSTPTSTVDPLLSLSHRIYGLPAALVANLAALGIRTIYPWQKQCLLGPGLLQGEANLVYSAPTGGGKSLVADVLMLRRVLEERNAKALLVLPYVALVQEKVRWLRSVVQGLSREALGLAEPDKQPQKPWAKTDRDTVRVVGFFGGSKVKHTWAEFEVGICTTEKANLLINTAMEDCSVSNLRVVVLDELHMIDEDSRGYLLELMATKLLCLEHVQIIGMSATLTNIGLLKDWLRGHSYETRYRPVPIDEHLVCDGRIYAAECLSGLGKTSLQSDPPSSQAQVRPAPVRTISPSEHKEFKDPVLNAVVALANETARANYGVLVFSNSRVGCESDALLISRVLCGDADGVIQDKRLDLLSDLQSLTTGLDPTLEQTIPFGVAFHHAGITTEERDLVAGAFDAGTLKVCVATCSLAAGVNLPARRVILHNVRMGRDLVGPSMLRQMRGRAGRKGKDEVGETYLCCREQDLEDVVDLMQADLPRIESCLISDKKRIQRALLEAIAVRLAESRESLDEFVGRTLLALCADAESVRKQVQTSLDDLQKMDCIIGDSCFAPTPLGKAIVASGFDPEDGVFIHRELKRSLQAFVLDGEMHVLYNFTPVYSLASSIPVNWRVFGIEIDQLDDSGLRVMQFLGLKHTVVHRMMGGGILPKSTPEEKNTARRYQRFYQALQLRDLCNEMPVHRVAVKYDVPRGTVQNLAQTCQGFAAGMIKFCEVMEWGAMAAALDHVSDRLKAGAKADLLALARITFVKSRTARVFWDNGFKTVAAVANAVPKELVPVLMQAQPIKVRLGASGGDKSENKFRDKMLAKANIIADSANRIWQAQMRDELGED